MSSGNGKKSVRFAQGTANAAASSRTAGSVARAAEAEPTTIGAAGRVKKRKRDRPNEDEIDDVDDWKPEDDASSEEAGDGSGAIPSQHKLLEAKQTRRLQREAGTNDNDDDDEENPSSSTRINRTTSLAAEGIEIEPFSMEQERSDGTGYFDGDTYVFRKRGADEEPDAWLESLDDKEDADESEKGANMAAPVDRKLSAAAAGKADSMDDRMDNWTEEDLYAKILPNLAKKETVMEAIIRYGNILKREKATRNDTSASESRQLAQDSLNDLTEAANALLLKGRIDIYQHSRSDIEKLIPARSMQSVSTQQTSNNSVVQWEYQGNEDGQIHGTYSTQEMLAWIRAGYFIGQSAVKVRTVTAAAAAALPEEKSLQDDLLDDLMDDDGVDKTTKKGVSESERGDWMISDEVDFAKYL